MLCRHLGFNETYRNDVETRLLGSGQDIATGDLICYNTQHASRTSCCIHLQPSRSTSNLNLPYVTCKICDKPLLQDASTFPDQVFSGSGRSSSYKNARFYNNGWCASGSGVEYLSIDLQKEYHLTRVVVMGNKNQTEWSESYSLKYSYNKTLVNQNSVQITGNQNGYQASVTSFDIYNVRHIKMESTGNTDFCLKIELCGEVQLPDTVSRIQITPSTFSALVSWRINGPTASSYITHYYINLNGTVLQRISREKYGTQFNITGLKPHTSYAIGIQTEDGSLQRSEIVSEGFKTEKAVLKLPPGPPVDVVVQAHGKNSLDVSWKPPENYLRFSPLTHYVIFYYARGIHSGGLRHEITKMPLSLTIDELRPSTKYFVEVTAVNKFGYGKKSVEVSKITNGEPVNPLSTSYYTLSLIIPKPAEYIKKVMVIVQNSTSMSSTLSEDIETNEIKPYKANTKDLYVTAYLKADVLPLTFVIGDGNEYNSEKVKYINEPLKQSSSYIVFLRFFENKDLYYSTEWSSSVKTMVKPQVECFDNQISEQSSDEKTRLDLLIPLVVVSLCFLLLLGVFVYCHTSQSRLLKNIQPSHKYETSEQPDRKEKTDNSKSNPGVNDADTVYETPDDILESNERNQPIHGISSAGQEPSAYMSLKDNKEPGNFYQPLQLPGKGTDHMRRGGQRDQTIQYQNPAFNAYYNDD